MSSPSKLLFRYEAARSDGVRVRGVVDAASSPDAAAVLSTRGLLPLKLEPEVEGRRASVRSGSPRMVATLFQSLASLVDAGVPLARALEATATLTTGAWRETVQRVADRVSQGASLASALAAENAFPAVAIGLVRAGEQGVGLATGLQHAARQLEHDAESRARIKASLTYPSLLAVVGTLSVALIVFYVIPRFAALLGDLGQAMPPATRLLLGITELLRHYGVVMGVGCLVVAVGAVRYTRHHRATWHEWLLRLPVIGPIRAALATARVGRTLSALLATGTPALHALRVAVDAVGDEAVADRLRRARDRVAEGASLSAALEATQAMTAAAIQLARIGEGSGRLPGLLATASDLDEQTAERQLKVLTSLLEPALIVAFAVLVAFVAAALLQAVYAVRPGGV